MDSETSTATSTCGDSSARKTFMVSWPVLAYAAQWISRGSSPPLVGAASPESRWSCLLPFPPNGPVFLSRRSRKRAGGDGAPPVRRPAGSPGWGRGKKSWGWGRGKTEGKNYSRSPAGISRFLERFGGCVPEYVNPVFAGESQNRYSGSQVHQAEQGKFAESRQCFLSQKFR